MNMTPQVISGASRRLIRHTDWAWLHGTYAGTPAENQAAKILRRDYDYAARWLRRVSNTTSLPLPAGNGTNGPWQRVAHITTTGHLGIVDIAEGRAAEYEIVVPWRVARFATPVARAYSHHDAGGSGGTPKGWRQITVTLGASADADCPTERIMPVRVIYGLSTCYGTIGTHPAPAEYAHGDWDPIATHPGIDIIETDEPQREEIPLHKGVQAPLWDEFFRSCDRDSWQVLNGVCVTHSGGNWGDLHYVYVYGMRPDRDRAIPYLLDSWRTWLIRRALDHAINLITDNGIGLPRTPGGSSAAPNSSHDVGIIYGRRLVAGMLIEPTGLTADQQALIERTARDLLALDPAVVGRGYRDPSGRPGYPTGGNHISYVTEQFAPRAELHALYGHLMEQPGVADWLKSTRDAAEAERTRIGFTAGYSCYVPDAEIEMIERAGYTVTRRSYGSITAALGK